MNTSKETFFKVFGLILIAVIPTLCIYILLEKFVGQAQLKGQTLGYTINFAGPIAFYAFIILIFRKWAVTSTSKQTISNQEELEAMTEYEKLRTLHEINGEISVLSMQRDYLSSLVNEGTHEGIPEITQIEVDESTIL